MSDSKKPAARINMHPITGSIWRNEKDEGVFYSATFERSYKDEAGNWKYTNSFNSGDLLLLAKVADLVHTEISKLRANDRQAQQPEDQAV